MKRLFIACLIATSPVLLSCRKSTCGNGPGQAMTVLKDCTGTYLRLDGKDYRVCNVKTLKNYADGTQVEAGFKKINSCRAEEKRIVCEMLHQNEGWVEVTSVR